MTETTCTLCVLDIETTGTDIENDVILEIGAIALTDDLKPISRFNILLPQEGYLTRVNLSEWVKTTHGKNGLLTELEAYPPRTLDELRFDASKLWSKWCVDNQVAHGKLIMCGRNVAGFDLPWIKKNYPDIGAWFHYRTRDTGTIMWYLQSVCGVKLPNAPKVDQHRSLPDCDVELAELQLAQSIGQKLGETHE